MAEPLLARAAGSRLPLSHAGQEAGAAGKFPRLWMVTLSLLPHLTIGTNAQHLPTSVSKTRIEVWTTPRAAVALPRAGRLAVSRWPPRSLLQSAWPPPPRRCGACQARGQALPCPGFSAVVHFLVSILSPTERNNPMSSEVPFG